jgi:small subunit ribosomal protein S6
VIATIKYELIYILNPTLPTEELDVLTQRFSETAQTGGAIVEQVTRWDLRRLAYPIKGHHEGYYVIMALQAEPPAIAEVERNLTLNESVLRHMVVRPDDKE